MLHAGKAQTWACLDACLWHAISIVTLWCVSADLCSNPQGDSADTLCPVDVSTSVGACPDIPAGSLCNTASGKLLCLDCHSLCSNGLTGMRVMLWLSTMTM